jgi:metal-sulfur cluster biosynthetic enzyme
MTESITLTKEEKIKKEIVENLRQVYDPEISINVYDLGLIYDINMSKLPEVTITHTLTSAFCPAADQIIDDIQQATECIDGVDKCMIITTFDPPFTKEMMSEEARMILNI